MPFEIVVLGAGDAFTAAHRNTSFLLDAGGRRLAVDCPDSYRRILAEASAASGRDLRVEDVGDLLLTHVHGDHVNGLEAVGFWKALVEKKRLTLWTTPEVIDVLWERRLRAAMEQLWDGSQFRRLSFEDYFDARPLSWDSPTAIGPFEVRIRRGVHHVPTAALRVSAGGRTWGYSCDTAWDPGLVEWLGEADLIFHETNLGPAHTPWERLAALPADLKRRMRLVHYPDGFDDAKVGIRTAREGDVLEV